VEKEDGGSRQGGEVGVGPRGGAGGPPSGHAAMRRPRVGRERETEPARRAETASGGDLQ
jgi:hypothetical protein